MKLSQDEVRSIATLARIALTDTEVEQLRGELSSILEYVEQLNAVPTDDVEPTSQVTGLENVWRDDEVTNQFTREQMLDSVIETAEDHLKIKAVFKK